MKLFKDSSYKNGLDFDWAKQPIFTLFWSSCSKWGTNTLLKRWIFTINSPVPPSVILILCYLFAKVEGFSGALYLLLVLNPE